MFGGLGIYRDGLMFGLVAGGDIYLKTDAENRPAFAAAGAAPFSYRAKGEMRQTSYLRLPDEALDEPDALRRWLSLGLEAAVRKAATRSAKRGDRL